MEPDKSEPETAEIKPAAPLQSQHTIAKNRRKDFFKKLMSVAILIFMVGWVFAAYYGITSSGDSKTNQNEITVGGYKFFVLQDGTFGTYINSGSTKVPIAFRLDPRNASKVSIDDTAVQQILSAKKIYITFDPNTYDKARLAVATAEISRITSLYSIQTVGAYIKDSSPPDPGVPIKTCDSVGNLVTVIELGISNTTAPGITNDKGCIKVFAETPNSLIETADKLGMNLIGIKL